MIRQEINSQRPHFRAAALALLCMATAMPAWAQTSNDWRKKLGVFRIGILGGNRPLLETRQFQPFRKTLQKALGVPVEVFPAKDHKALVEALVGGRIEYAPLSITAFVAAWNSCKCVEPVALSRATDGSTAFRSVLITKRGGPRSLRSLKGKTTIVPGKHSFCGLSLPARKACRAADRTRLSRLADKRPTQHGQRNRCAY